MGKREIYVRGRDRPREIQADKLAHFALSVFWRSVAHRWKFVGKLPDIALGPYQERIRQFLAGEAEFPKDACLLHHGSWKGPFQFSCPLT